MIDAVTSTVDRLGGYVGDVELILDIIEPIYLRHNARQEQQSQG
jgi:hypothetical protein